MLTLLFLTLGYQAVIAACGPILYKAIFGKTVGSAERHRRLTRTCVAVIVMVSISFAIYLSQMSTFDEAWQEPLTFVSAIVFSIVFGLGLNDLSTKDAEATF